MKKLALFILAFATVVFITAPTAVTASDLLYTHVGNGIYRYYNTNRYYRIQNVYYQAGYDNGCYFSAGYYPTYVEVQYTPPVTPSDPNWRTKLLEIAAQRDKVEGDLRKAALEQKYFNDSVTSLGLSNNFRWEGYGQHIGYGYPGGYFGARFYGANASTLYGSTLNTTTDLYGQLDINSLFQQANLLTKRQQDLNGDAMGRFAELVAQAGANQADVARIAARAKALALLAQSLEVPSAKITTTRTTFGQNPTVGQPPVPPPVQQQDAPPTKLEIKTLWQASAVQNCLSCHGGKGPDGKIVIEGKTKFPNGFDVTKSATWTREQKAVIMERLTTTDVARRMPKGGNKLDDDEIALWMMQLSQQ